MTSLGTSPVPNPDELALFADCWTTVAKPFADRFREACLADGAAHAGEVNPSRVRARLIAGGGIDNPRQLSALWSTATARGGYLVNTETYVPITGEGSRGNTNKSVRLRRLA